jgi:tetratricopeptide (TPR) repeat protein
LEVAKRCIKYVPQVLDDRKTEVLNLVEGLNSPFVRWFLLSGPYGSGKTSLLRGLAELLSSNPATQVLWFELPASQNALHLCQHLLLQAALLHTQPTATPMATGGTEQAKALLSLSRQWAFNSPQQRQTVFESVAPYFANPRPHPLLVVLDGLDAFMGEADSLEAPALEETLAFLAQSLPQLKWALVSRNPLQLGGALQALAPLQSQFQLALGPLPASPLPLVFSGEEEAAQLTPVFTLAQSQPWLHTTLLQLHSTQPQRLLQVAETVAAAAAASPQAAMEALLQALAQQYWQQAQQPSSNPALAMAGVGLLCTLRHAISEATWQALLPQAPPRLKAWAKPLGLWPWLKCQAEPQVIQHSMVQSLLNPAKGAVVAGGNALSSLATPSVTTQLPLLLELATPLRHALYHQLPLSQKHHWHVVLEGYYTQQVQDQGGASPLLVGQPLLQAQDALFAEREARYHKQQAQALRLQLQQQANPTATPAASPEEPATPKRQRPTAAPSFFEPFSSRSSGMKESDSLLPRDLHPLHLDQLYAEQVRASYQRGEQQAAITALFTLATHRLNEGMLDGVSPCLASAQSHIEQLLQQHPADDPLLVRLQAQWLQLQGQLSQQQQAFTPALTYLQRSLALWQQLGNASLLPQAQCCFALAQVYQTVQAPTAQVLPYLQSILELLPPAQSVMIGRAAASNEAENSKTQLQAQTLHWLGQLLEDTQMAEALSAYQQAHHYFLSLGQFEAAAESLAALAQCLWREGALEEALACIDRSLNLQRQATQAVARQQQAGEASAERYLQAQSQQWQHQRLKSVVQWDLGYKTEALDGLKQAIAQAGQHGYALWEAKLLSAMGELLAEQPENLPQAIGCFQQALSTGQGVLSKQSQQRLAQRMQQWKAALQGA